MKFPFFILLHLIRNIAIHPGQNLPWRQFFRPKGDKIFWCEPLDVGWGKVGCLQDWKYK